MRDAGKSRWADSEEDQALEAQRKREKEDKKRAKTEKARLEAEAVEARQRQEAEAAAASREQAGDYEVHDASRASKRRKVSAEAEGGDASSKKPLRLFRPDTHGWGPSRHISNFELLNHIEEGSYGWVSRAKETATGEIVALKRLKMDGSDHNGFPVTGLREIQCLQQARHKHIVGLREVVVGDMLSVYLVMDFVEHDLKTLQEDMREPFSTSEVKTLLLQLGDALSFLQDHWILHVSGVEPVNYTDANKLAERSQNFKCMIVLQGAKDVYFKLTLCRYCSTTGAKSSWPTLAWRDISAILDRK